MELATAATEGDSNNLSSYTQSAGNPYTNKNSLKSTSETKRETSFDLSLFKIMG